MKRSNKFLAILLVMLLAASLLSLPANTASAVDKTIKVELDNKPLSFDVPPTIEKGRTLVPLRAIFEALGALVKWEPETKTVTAVKGNTTVKLSIGSKTAYKNNEEIVLDVPAKIINGRTFIPLRFISESMGYKVKWEETSRLVSISSGGIIKKIAEKIAGAVEKVVKPKATEEVAEKREEVKSNEKSHKGRGSGGGGGSRSKPAPPTEITITDSTGRKITIPQPLNRIVLLNSNVAEVISILGAQDRVVGVADNVKTGPFIGMNDKPGLGKWTNPDLEKIIELNPQVVIAYGNLFKNTLEKLQKVLEPHIKVVALDCYAPKTLESDMRTLARMVGKENRIENYLKWKNQITGILKEKTAILKPEEKVKVLYLSTRGIYRDDYSTVGKNTSGHLGMIMAGSINIYGESKGYPKISLEDIVNKNPDVLLISCYCKELGYLTSDYSKIEDLKRLLVNNKVLNQINAIKNDRVYFLAHSLLGGINTYLGSLYLAKWFYPEHFKDIDPEKVYKEYIENWLGAEYKGRWSYPPF